MEQRKPRNKKGSSKSVKQRDESSKVPVDIRNTSNETAQGSINPSIKKLNPEDYDYVNSDKSQFAHLKRETQVDTEEKDAAKNNHSRRKVLSNWGKYEEIPDTEIPGKDFQSLLDVPISQGGHFVFRSEKNWAIEVTKYSDLFSLNVKKLARDINCIPFGEYIDVEDKYFTADQLTRFYNLAELSKPDIKAAIISERPKNSGVTENSTGNQETRSKVQTQESIEIPGTIQGEKELEDDLDFLLSLKEPVEIDQPRITHTVYPTQVEEQTDSTSSVPVKSIDLEKWLDSILDG